MGAYLDRLNAQFDEVREGIEALTLRASEDNREVTEAEQAQVVRDRARLDELQTAIEHYSALDAQTARVATLRSTAPAVTTTRVREPEPVYDVAREFETPADYAIAVHRAFALRDPEARERIERATAHQTTTDNPGIIPRPVVGGLVTLINATRPFINSITRKPLPAGKFDRPRVTQHVAVGVQAAEKDLTASQKMLVDLMPVTAKTYAGHLNISRQDIKWTSPGILNLVFEDFAAIYALTTCADAVTQFVASVTQTSPITAPPDAAKINAALFGAVAESMTDMEETPDTLWVAPDVWAGLGGMTNPATGAPSYPSLSLTNPSGSPLGLRLVVDGHFPAGTAILGPSRYAEWYEDVDGLMQVQEPDVLGQLVGYAGFGAFLNTVPGAFTKITGAVVPGDDSGETQQSKSTSK